MAKNITVSRTHGSTQEDALEKLKGLTGQLVDKYGVAITPTADGATVKGKGISGGCKIDAREVTISLSLGLMLRPLSGRIEAGIKRAMEQHFG